MLVLPLGEFHSAIIDGSVRLQNLIRSVLLSERKLPLQPEAKAQEASVFLSQGFSCI